jgi:hypothetical protein
MASKPAGTPAAAKPAAAPAVAPANATPAGVAGANATKQGASIVLASGEKRVDYIRRRYGEGAKRGEIAKELGVPYQIVFAATKTKKETVAKAA